MKILLAFIFMTSNLWAAQGCHEFVSRCIEGALAGKKDCRSFKGVSPLAFQSDLTVQPWEHLFAGEEVKSAKGLAGISDGQYLYLITSDGKVYFSSRTPVFSIQSGDPYLATHRSVYRKILEKNQDTKILAAGEFKKVNGRVSMVNNKSGSFRGGKENLDFAVDQLKRKGLAVEEKSLQVDFRNVKSSSLHASEAELSRMETEVHSDPDYLNLKKLYADLEKKYPSPTTPGHINTEEIGKKIMSQWESNFKAAKNPALSKVDRTALEDYDSLLQLATMNLEYFNKEGLAFIVSKIHKNNAMQRNSFSKIKLGQLIELYRKILLN